eukprot:Awhi_evm2s14611
MPFVMGVWKPRQKSYVYQGGKDSESVSITNLRQHGEILENMTPTYSFGYSPGTPSTKLRKKLSNHHCHLCLVQELEKERQTQTPSRSPNNSKSNLCLSNFSLDFFENSELDIEVEL